MASLPKTATNGNLPPTCTTNDTEARDHAAFDGLSKAIAAAKARADQREAVKVVERERDRRVISVALGVVLNALPRIDLIGQDLQIWPGVFGEVTERQGVRIVRRCPRGHAIEGIYISNPTERTLADLGDLLQSRVPCAMCPDSSDGEEDSVLSVMEETVETVIIHLYRALRDDKAAWPYHVSTSIQKLEEQLAQLRGVQASDD